VTCRFVGHHPFDVSTTGARGGSAEHGREGPFSARDHGGAELLTRSPPSLSSFRIELRVGSSALHQAHWGSGAIGRVGVERNETSAMRKERYLQALAVPYDELAGRY
jgi:hypothetical protein